MNRPGLLNSFLNKRKRHWQLYLMALPAVLWLLIFRYVPMYGVVLSFKNFTYSKGIIGSEWAGFVNFQRLFKSYWFPTIIKNTLTISLLSMALNFPMPIILALMVNEIKVGFLKRTFQTVSYAPHFISTIVVCGMITLFLSPDTGIVNQIIMKLGGESIFFLQSLPAFKWIYAISGVWQGAGWSAIIYTAALAGVDLSLLEAADIDGANRMQKIWHINIPVLVPTIVILFIMSCGSLLSVGYEKTYALQNSTNVKASEVISTYVYKVGLIDKDFSFSTATGLLNSLVNAAILIMTNAISRSLSDISMW